MSVCPGVESGILISNSAAFNNNRTHRFGIELEFDGVDL